LLAGLGSLVLGSFFNGTGNTWVTFKMALLTLLILVPLTPILTLFYGVLGLILAQIISNFFGTLYGFTTPELQEMENLLGKTTLLGKVLTPVIHYEIKENNRIIFSLTKNLHLLFPIFGLSLYLRLQLSKKGIKA